jgi:proteasome lid subunit RPN8/RPN11
MISIAGQLIEQIEAHGERDYPHECGGMLIGHFDAEKGKTVIELLPMENSSEESTRHNRVLILPKDVMRAERYAREKKLDVVGRAFPSQFDLDHALPVWSYIIVSVLQGKAADVRSWEMENDRSKFNAEELNSEY